MQVFGQPKEIGARPHKIRPAISMMEIRTGLVDGLECVDDRFHRVAVMFRENPVGVILSAFHSIAKDNRGLLQQHKVTRFLYFCENVRVPLYEAR
jgi:hypothetical protein